MHDHLERDRLHSRKQLEGLVERPAVDFVVADRGHQLAVLLHAIALKWQPQQVALFRVLVPVEHQDRSRPENRRGGDVRLAAVHQLGTSLEYLVDQLRISYTELITIANQL